MRGLVAKIQTAEGKPATELVKGSGGSDGGDAEVADAVTSSNSGVATNIKAENCETLEDVLKCAGLLDQKKDMGQSLLKSCPGAQRGFYVEELSVIDREMEVLEGEARAIKAATAAAVAAPSRRKKGKR